MDPTQDPLVKRARAYATEAHRRIDQRRKYTDKPYDVHLKRVAALVAQVSDDPAMVAAAWLHDVVEDTPATLDDVERTFGGRVAALVEQLTDVSRPSDGNRERRVAINRMHTARASSEAKTIKLADLIDNCRDICKHDPRFAPTYLAEMAALLGVLREGDARLYRKCETLVQECSGRLGLGQARSSRHGPVDTFDSKVSDGYARTLRRYARKFVADDLAEPLPPSGKRTPPEARAGQLVAPDAPLSDVIEVLTRHDVCYVGHDGVAEGRIRRQDVQKPVARTWLFGMITMFELYLTREIRTLWPDGSWTSHLTPSRLQAAENLRSERARRGQACELLDCLQISDKGAIVLRNPAQLAAFGFGSRRSGELVIKELQSLRNNLAHAQDIVSNDWPQIVRLARRLESIVLDRPEGPDHDLEKGEPAEYP